MEEYFIIAGYFIGFIAFAFLAWLLRRGPRGSYLPSIISLFCVAYAFMYFFFPALQIAGNSFKYERGYSNDTFIGALILFVVFGSAVVIAYIAFVKTGPRFHKHIDDVRSWKLMSSKTLVAAIIIMVVPSGISVLYMIRMIGVYGVGHYIADRIILSSGSGYMIAPMHWITLFSSILAVDLLHNKFYRGKVSSRTVIIYLVLLLMSCATGILQGSRSQTLLPVVTLFALYFFFFSLRRGFTFRIKHATLIILAVVGVFAVGNILGYLRTAITGCANMSAVLNKDYSLSKSDDILNGLTKFGTAENVFWLIEHRGWDLQYGKTFLSVAVGFVPRSLWPEKPVGGGPVLKNMIYPGSYNLNSSTAISSTTTGLPAEAIMNFGVLGIPIVALLYGFMLSRISMFVYRIKSSTHFIAFAYLAFVSIGYLWGEFFGTTSWLFIYLFPIGILFFLIPRSYFRPNHRIVQLHADNRYLIVGK